MHLDSVDQFKTLAISSSRLAWTAQNATKPVDPFLEKARTSLLNEPGMVSVFGDIEYNSKQGFTWAEKKSF